MQQITVTVDMTPENLEILKQLCPASNSEVKAPETKKTTKKATEKPAPVEAAGTDAPAETIPEAEDKPDVSLTDVRAVALKLSKAGKQDVLKAAFEKFGGKKLSDIKPDDYPALMAELTKEAGNNA